MKIIAQILFLSIVLCGCTSLPQASNSKNEQTIQNTLSSTIVPHDPMQSMRIECDKDETVAFKLAMFKQYLKKQCNIDLHIYLSPEAANTICKAEPTINYNYITIDDVALGDCITYFCRAYGLRFLITDNVILIDIK